MPATTTACSPAAEHRRCTGCHHVAVLQADLNPPNSGRAHGHHASPCKQSAQVPRAAHIAHGVVLGFQGLR